MKKGIKTTLIFAFLISMSVSSKSQRTWLFGYDAGIIFNNNPNVLPAAYTNASLNPMATREGCSLVHDNAGNVLFSTDGMTVYDRNGSSMLNGGSLLGGSSATQSAIIVPVPGCCDSKKYFVFTIGSWSSGENESNAKGLHYSIVDLTLNGGLGEVVLKNIPLVDPSVSDPVRKGFVTEKLTAMGDGSGGYWVLSHGNKTPTYTLNGKRFYAFHLTPTSNCSTPSVDTISPNFITTDIGPEFFIVPNSTSSGVVGQMKFSQAGNKIAVAECSNQKVYLFDFNQLSGVVSNPQNITLSVQIPNPLLYSYGVEFSKNGDYVYTSTIRSGHIFQTSVNNFDNAHTNVLNTSQIGFDDCLGALQLANDGNIYAANYHYGGKIGVIRNADFPTAYYTDQIINCTGSSLFSLPTILVHNYCTPCDTVTTTTVNTVKTDVTGTLNNGSITVSVTGASGPYSHSWSNGSNSASISNLAGGYYTDTIKDRNGCIKIEEVYICSPSTLTILHSLSNTNCTAQTANVTSLVTGGVEPYTHTWTYNNSAGPSISNIPFGTYTHTVTDSKGCTTSEDITIACPQTPSFYCEGNAYQIAYNYTLPVGVNLSEYRIKLQPSKNGNPITCSNASNTNLQPTASSGTIVFYMEDNSCPGLAEGCIDYIITVERTVNGNTTIVNTIGSYNNGGIVAGINNDACCGTQNPPTPDCQSDCNLIGTYNTIPPNGTHTTLVNGSTYDVACNTQYEGDVRLVCQDPGNPVVPPIFRNQSGQIINSFWSGGIFNFTSAGIYTATYYKTDAAGNRCDSMVVTFNVACPPACQPNCNFTGNIFGLTGPGSSTPLKCDSVYNVQCNKNYQGGVFLDCVSPASSTLLTGVFRNQNGQIVNVWGNGYYNFPAAGIYTATYYKTNGTVNCDSCTIRFNVTCVSPPPQCNCSVVSLPTPRQSINNAAYQPYAGGLIAVPCGSTNKFYVDVPIMPSYCSNVSVVAELRDNNNVLLSQPNTGNDAMNPLVYQFSNAGTYTLSYTLLVNGVECNKINIPISTDCVTETCKDWVYKGFFTEGEASPSGPVYIACGTVKNTAQGKWIYVYGARNCGPSGLATVKTIIYGPQGNIVSQETLGDYNAVDSVRADTCGRYTIKLISECGKLPCDTCTYYVDVACPVACNCKTAKCVAKYFYKNDAGGDVPLNCKAGPIQLQCNLTYRFQAAVNCQNNCNAVINGDLYLNGSLMQSYSNISITNPANLSFTASGGYTFIYRLMVNGVECSKCPVEIKVNCPPPTCTPCKTTITGTAKNLQMPYQNITSHIEAFTFNNLPANITEVKAVATNFSMKYIDAGGKENNECALCNVPAAAWASIFGGGAIDGIKPTVNISGVETNSNITLPQIYPDKNPRQATWSNGSILNVSNTITVGFILPPASTLSCCTRRATICMKFIFRDNNCMECIVNRCFDVDIK